MKVRELIEKLQHYSGDCEVTLYGSVMEDAWLTVEKTPGSNECDTILEDGQ